MDIQQGSQSLGGAGYGTDQYFGNTGMPAVQQGSQWLGGGAPSYTGMMQPVVMPQAGMPYMVQPAMQMPQQQMTSVTVPASEITSDGARVTVNVKTNGEGNYDRVSFDEGGMERIVPATDENGNQVYTKDKDGNTVPAMRVELVAGKQYETTPVTRLNHIIGSTFMEGDRTTMSGTEIGSAEYDPSETFLDRVHDLFTGGDDDKAETAANDGRLADTGLAATDGTAYTADYGMEA